MKTKKIEYIINTSEYIKQRGETHNKVNYTWLMDEGVKQIEAGKPLGTNMITFLKMFNIIKEN